MDLDAIDVVEIESENSGDEKYVDSKSILNDQSDKDLVVPIAIHLAVLYAEEYGVFYGIRNIEISSCMP